MATYTVRDKTTGKTYTIRGPENASDFQIKQYLQSQLAAEKDDDDDVIRSDRGLVRGVGDFVGGVAGAVPKAAAGIVSLGSLVKGLNVIADPVAEALMDAGEWVDEAVLSDYQKNINSDMARAMADSARELGPDASVTDHVKNIASQGGAAAKFVVQNPSQAIMLAGQAIPYLFGGGVLARGTQAVVKGGQAVLGAKATGLSTGTAAAVGEGLMAGGAVTGDVVGQLRDEGITEYTADRLVGIPAGIVTAGIGRLGAKISGGLDADTAIANKLSGAPVDLVADAPQRGLIRRTAIGAGAEGTEEFFQSGSEQAFTNIGVGDPVSQDVGSSAVFGAAAGAGVGGVVGALQKPNNSETKLDTNVAQQLAEEEAQLQAQALAEEQKQQKQAEALDDAVYEVRAEAAKTFTPEEKFMAERKKARDTQSKAAVADPQTELGAAFKNFLKAQREAGKAPIYGGKKLEAAQKEFLKGYDKDNQERYDAEDLAAYEQALDLHAQQLADGTITPEVKAEPSVNAAVSEERKQEINVEAENIAEELSPTIVTSQPAAVDPMTIPIRQRKDAIRQVEALVEDGSLSPNWAEQNEDLNGAINGERFQIKPYKEALDKVLNPVEETEVAVTAEQTVEPEIKTQAANTLSVITNMIEKGHKGKALTENQAKVANVLQDAFMNNEESTIQQADGTLNPTIIADKAGIKNRQAANRAVQSLQNKIAEAYGVTPEQVKERLKATGTTSSEEFDQNAPTEVFDAADLGEGSGTAASVGQGAYTDVTEEDRVWTEERVKEPDQYESKRQEIADQSRASLTSQMIQQYGNEAIAQWRSLVSDGAIDIKNISKKDLVEWVAAVAENREGLITDDQLSKDQREIERRYATEETNNERLGTSPTQIAEGGNTVEQVGTEDTGTPPEGNPDDFTAGQQKTAVVETKKKRKIDRSKIKFGLLSDLADKLRTQLLDDSPESKRQRFENVVKDLTGKTGAYNAEIFDTFADFAAARIRGDINAKVDFGSSENAIPSDAYAFTIPDVKGRPVAFFFLDRIPAGRERAVFMHEVGGHVGIDEILSVEERENIQTKIEKWAISDEQNLENIVARRALQRVQNARDAFKAKDPFFGFMLDSEVTAETIGYFLEEATFAGVEPSVTTALGRLVRDLYAAFKRALRKVGLQPDNLTPKDIVDIGWGAARFQLSTRKHGTAQDFKKFDHMKMGSGEGAQVYGWGTYLAERLGIARWYMDQDIKRKERDLLNSPRVMNFTANNLAKFSTFSPLLQKVIKSTKPKGVSVDLSRFANLSEDSNIGSVGYDPAFDELFVFYKTKNGMGRTLPLLPLVRSTSLEDDSVPFDLYDEVDEIKKELKANYDKFQKELDVQGALLHVDTTVDNDELLRWDEPQRGQTADNIVNLLKSMDRYDALNIIEGAQQANGSIVNDTDILDRTRQAIGVVEGTDDQSAGDGLFEETVENVTGRDLYAAMAIYDGRFDNALMDYLDTKTMMNKVFKLADGEWVESDAVRDDDGMLVPHMLHRSDKVVSMLLDQAGVKGVIYPDAGTRGAPLDPIGMANNQVIFNDENVFIVGSTPGGSVSKKRYSVDEIKFGRNADWVGNTFGAPAKNAYDTTVDIAKGGAKSVAFLHDLVRKHGDKMPAIKRWYEGMLKAEAIRNEIRMGFEDIAVRARDLKLDRLALVNDFLGKSTFFQQWGYDPKDYHPDLFAKKEVKVNDIMEKAFGRLTKDEKQLVADVFAHGEKMRQRKVEIAKKLGVEGKFFTDAALDGPYAPLKRFGRHVAELKSAELVAAEKRLETSDTKENKKTVNELKSKPEHYIIRFFDTSGSAQQFVDANASKYAESAATEKAPDVEIDRVTNPEVYEKIIARLNAGPEAKIASEAKTAFKEMVKNLYFQSLDERSARLSGSRRLNRAGYEPNMMRSFLSHARAEASLISQMETGTEVNSALAEAGKQVKGDKTVRDPERQSVYNMIVRHYRDGLVNRNTPFQALQDRVTAINSAYMLTSSIGYHLTNATQPAMVTVPKIAGDFNNYSGAWSALFKGYKVAMSATRMSRDMQTRIDLEKAPVQYRKLLENLQLRQLLDVGMEEDLSEFDRFNTGLEFVDKASEGLGRIAHKLYQVARFVEAQNRISAAVAAYDMAQKDPKRLSATKMNALDYAVSVVEDSQGNFSRLDAPLLIKVLPKVTVQYRKYQLLMAWHYSKAFKQSFLNDDPVTTAIGRRTLAYSIAHAALGAGATGIPLLSTAFWLTTFLGDEDEPDDLERAIKRVAGDDTLGTVLSRGLFAGFGVDLSTKLNQSKIFHPLPYVDFQTGESGAKDIFFNALAGPSGTTGVNFYRAHEYFKQGDLLKGIEYSVPKGIRTAMESYRLATEGYTMRNGDVVVDPREIDAFSLLVNAMGIPATEIQEIKWTRGQQYELEQYFSKESGKIRKKYVEANKARNRNKMQSLREEWRELQDAKDRVRPFFNNARGVLNRQSVSDLIKAPREQRKREQKARRQLTGN